MNNIIRKYLLKLLKRYFVIKDYEISFCITEDELCRVHYPDELLKISKSQALQKLAEELSKNNALIFESQKDSKTSNTIYRLSITVLE